MPGDGTWPGALRVGGRTGELYDESVDCDAEAPSDQDPQRPPGREVAGEAGGEVDQQVDGEDGEGRDGEDRCVHLEGADLLGAERVGRVVVGPL